MLECKDIRPLLPDYAAGNLEEETAAQVADHLLLCPICAAELEALRAAAYQPALVNEARSFATEDPLAGTKKGEPEAEAAAEAQTTDAVAQPVDAPPKKPRLRRRTKVLIALIVLVVVGACAGILHSRDTFSIRDWEKTGDKSFAAVVYKGAQAGEKDGFRIRLWNEKEKEWYTELPFHDAAYRKLVWSPNGRFAAVEFTDAEHIDRVFVIDVIGAQTAVSLPFILSRYLSQHDGYFGNVPLAVAPSCKILQWLPDSTKLLIAAEGVVDTNIDPDYGIELANSTPIQPRDNNAPTVSGYFAYDAEDQEIKNINGFGQQDEKERFASLQEVAMEFRDTGMMVAGMNETYYQADALVELAKLPEGRYIQGVTYRLAVTHNLNFAYESWDRLRTSLTADSSVILLTDSNRLMAYVIVIP